MIGTFYKVYRTLGYGFLEKVYQNALYDELIERGFICRAQQPVHGYYKGKVVGESIADLVVNDKMILELKASKELYEEHECQLVNYLKATHVELGLLLNFGEHPQVRRKICKNKNK
ncbi:MAG: GxxExxY protein [Tannerellaceae bacterium]|nr:GxxExxY protein [Tannerellaceae bacterium]